jgi:hypothetical protein
MKVTKIMVQHHKNKQEKPPKIIRMENKLSPKNHKNTNPKSQKNRPTRYNITPKE